MTKNTLQNLGSFFALFIIALNINAQICDAGDDIDADYNNCKANGLSNFNLDDLLLTTTKNIVSSSKVLVRRWEFVSGPDSPRGKRVVKIKSDSKSVDFPNTGAGPEEEYTFKYIVTDDGCSDSAIVKVCVLGDDSPSFTESELFICEGDLITNVDELFNASPLNEIRDLDGFWEDADNNEISASSFPIGEGAYTYLDSSSNINDVLVYELPCSNKDINLSFENAQNTSDGNDHYFEVDVMIQTINSTGSFDLRDGKLFFQYNTEAFGEFVNAYNRVEIAHPDGQSMETDPDGNIYDNNNNGSTNRFSWKFSQTYSNFFTSATVNDSKKKLCHLKLKYIDNTKLPLLTFESSGIYDNQFSEGAPRHVISNDFFDSNGATLTNNEFDLLNNISVYPNPTKNKIHFKGDLSKVNTIDMYSITGKHVMSIKNHFEEVNISRLESSIYFVKLNIENATKTFKIIKE